MTNPVVVRMPLARDADTIAWVHVQGWRETYAHLLPARFYDDVELAARRERGKRISAGEQVDFLTSTAEIRSGDWLVADPAPGQRTDAVS